MVHTDTKDIQKAGFDKEKVKQCWIKVEKTCFLGSKGINFLYSCNNFQVCKEGFIHVYPTQGLFKCQMHLRSRL